MMARTGLDRVPFPPRVESDGSVVCGRWRSIIGPAWSGGSWTLDLGSRTVPVSSGQFLPEPPSASPIWGQLYSPVCCGRDRLDRGVPAIWSGEMILTRLHPPPVFSFARKTIQYCPTPGLLQDCTSVAVLFCSLHLPRHWGGGGQMSVLHLETRTFLDPGVAGSSSYKTRGTV